MNLPSIILGGGVHCKACWLIAYCFVIIMFHYLIVFESTDDELTELHERIKSAIASKCHCPDTTGDKNHCHEIRSSDVSNAIV